LHGLHRIAPLVVEVLMSFLLEHFDPTLTPARYMQWLIPDKIMVYRISA
jgi:hypothetical protein